MNTTLTRLMLIASGFMLTGIPATASADEILDRGLYHLGNHPDGSASDPHYGLRLDELIDATSGHDIFTFDFEHADADMQMAYDGSRIQISGTAFGGLDGGSEYTGEFDGLWSIDFTYRNVATVDGDDDLAVTTPNYTNHGTITRLATGETFDLFDYAGHHGYTFRLGDEDKDKGHRRRDGVLSGWGWMNYQADEPHVYSADWLFSVGDPVPGPASIGLLGVGGLFMARSRRRRG